MRKTERRLVIGSMTDFFRRSLPDMNTKTWKFFLQTPGCNSWQAFVFHIFPPSPHRDQEIYCQNLYRNTGSSSSSFLQAVSKNISSASSSAFFVMKDGTWDSERFSPPKNSTTAFPGLKICNIYYRCELVFSLFVSLPSVR